MGQSISVANTSVTQNSLFDIYNSSETNCVSFTNNTLKNLNFVVTSSTIPGGITVDQTGSANASCIIDNQIENVSQQIFENLQTSQAEPGKAGLLGLGIAVQVSNATTVQDIEAAIKTSINNLCSAQTTNLGENYNFIITSSEVGEINVTQNGSAQADCVVTNLAKINAQSKAINETTAAAGGDRGLIATIITVIIIITILTLIVGFASKLFKKPATVPAAGACLPYPCDALSGKEYTTCAAAIPFDANVYCAPTLTSTTPVSTTVAVPAAAPVVSTAPSGAVVA